MRRACESLLQSLLEDFPCVAVIGVRQCGKTTLLKTLPSHWKQLDLERRADFEVVSRDPDAFFRLHSDHIALDEAQLAPNIFAALRVAIDDRRHEKGRFVITGSSSPTLLRSVSDSLAGRVGIIELAPLSWEEITETSAQDSLLGRLLDSRLGIEDLTEGLTPRGSLATAHSYWFRGGYPEPWLNQKGRFQERWIEQYIRTYLQQDVKRLFPGLDEVRFRRFLEMLGGLSGQTLNFSEIARALAVSQPTARDYFEIAHGTLVWRQLPAFTRNSAKRIVKHPRGYLRDSGLVHSLLRIPDMDALLSHPQMGRSWEGMVIEEVIRQLNAKGVGHEAYYYRTSGGAEVDLVLEGAFGLIAIEIKHRSSMTRRELRPLRDFVAEHKARLGIVINNDTVIRRYDDDLIGIPFQML